MKRLLPIFSLFTLYSLLFTISTASAQTTPSPACSCTPREVLRCYDTIPDGWCGKDPEAIIGRGKMVSVACDCSESDVSGSENCYDACPPPKPQITPVNYSFEDSIGDFNEYTEKAVHSGTRPAGIPVDPSDPNNYGAVAVLVPAGGPNHELRVKFVQTRGDYEVVLGDGTTKKAKEIWNECTENGDLNNWQNYQEKLENCSDWGFVPTTYRRLASEPTPAVQAKDPYFKDPESPFVMSWSIFAPLAWVQNFFQNLFCGTIGWFCPNESLPLRNPDNAAGWTKGQPNIPLESVNNAQVLRQFLLPQNFPLGELPNPQEDTYFQTTGNTQAAAATARLLEQTGWAAQQTSAEGGLFRIFQPWGITSPPDFCKEDSLNPGECASDYYFQLTNASTNACEGALCHTDTPDEKTKAPERPVDDRPLYLKSGLKFFQKSLWPIGL